MSSPVALITGGSRGIGQAIGQEFQRQGLRVVSISRSAPTWQPDLWIEADITTADGRQKVLDTIQLKFERLDILLNNAGRGTLATWEEQTEEDLRNVFELNVFAPVAMSRLMLPMLKNSQGCIINTSSVASRLPVACMGAYCATKAALTAFSDTLRMELQPHGVRVLNLVVGRINTGFSKYCLGDRTPPKTPGKSNAQALARQVYTAYRKGHRELVYPRWYRWIFALPRLLPGLYTRGNLKHWGLKTK
jgi:short-subunit dehydrogenase